MNVLFLPFKALLRLYVAITGCLTVYTIGIIDKYTPEHKRFLTSGFICASCKGFLLKKTMVADVIIKDAEGNEVPMLKTRSKGKYFCCPRCNHSWMFRDEKNVPKNT